MPFGSVVAPADLRRVPSPLRGPLVRPVAASTALRAVLAGAAAGRVLAAFPTALYVGLDDDVVAVVTTDGLRLPNALVLATAGSEAPFAGHLPGAPAGVRDGALQVGDLVYRPVREWVPRAVLSGSPEPVRRSVVEALAQQVTVTGHRPDVARALRVGAARLRTALALDGDRQDLRAAARDAVHALVGLGPGLTPSGDDLLAGALFTAACVSGFLQGFVLFLALPLDLGAPFGGLVVVGGVVALGLWLFALHLVVVCGWLATQSLDDLLERRSAAAARAPG